MVSRTDGVLNVLNISPIDIDGTFQKRVKDPEPFGPSNTLEAIELGEINIGDSDIREFEEVKTPTPEERQASSLERTEQTRQALNLARSGVEILNANFKFEQISGRARLNIMMAEYERNQVLNLGRQQALRAETEGYARGQNALLNAVAQGQDVSEGIARSSQLAEETFGIYSAMAIEANSIRKAYGFDSEILVQESAINEAEIERDLAIYSSALTGLAGSSDLLSDFI